MELRSATPHDVPLIVPMVRKLCDLHAQWDQPRYAAKDDVTILYSHWLTARASDPTSVFLYAHDDGTPAGFLIGITQDEIPIYKLKQYGFIADLWVEELYRNEGVARQLTMLAIERFKAMGLPQIRLETAHANDIARNLFASAGFRASVVEMTLDL